VQERNSNCGPSSEYVEKLFKFTFDSFPRDSENTITKEFHIMDGLMEMEMD